MDLGGILLTYQILATGRQDDERQASFCLYRLESILDSFGLGDFPRFAVARVFSDRSRFPQHLIRCWFWRHAPWQVVAGNASSLVSRISFSHSPPFVQMATSSQKKGSWD